jgi:hypothetical protein
MALSKVDVLSLGRGSLVDNVNAAIIFSANNIVALYAAGTTYAQYNVAEYSGVMYRSKINANTANTPSSSPSDWETLYIGPKDGDLAIIISGSTSSIMQRRNGVWSDLGGEPSTVTLADNQPTTTDAIVFLASQYTYAKIEYTLTRGGNPGQRRAGTYIVLNDNASDVEYDNTFTDIGADVGTTITWTISGGNVHMQYTSTNQGQALELKYTITGWS